MREGKQITKGKNQDKSPDANTSAADRVGGVGGGEEVLCLARPPPLTHSTSLSSKTSLPTGHQDSKCRDTCTVTNTLQTFLTNF